MRDILQLRLGRVIAALPATNHYLVSVVGIGKVPAVGAGSGSDTRSGHRSAQSHPPGSMVVVLDPMKAVNEDNNEGYPYAILCGIPLLENTAVTGKGSESTDTDFVQRSLDLMSDLGFLDNEVIQTFLQVDLDTMLQDRGSNHPTDLVPGSWAKFTAGGGAALLSNMLARFGISPECYTQYFYVEGREQRNANEFEKNSNTDYSWEGLRGDRSIRHGYGSADVYEATGGVGKPPVYEVDGETELLTLVDENAKPLPRYTNLGGGYFDGDWRVLATPKDSPTIFTADETLRGLLSVEERYDGVTVIKAARELRLEKTPYIPVPEEIKDVRNEPRSEDPDEDVTPIWEGMGFDSEEDFRQVRHLLDVDSEEFDRLRPGFRVDVEEGIWMVHTEDYAEDAEENVPVEPSLPKLDPDAMEYGIEALESEEITITEGRKVKLFKNSSAFIMTDEGGIILSDGFGSELRMHRGNVTITCPGDLKVQPGRDLIELVPRKAIRKAGERQEITSSNDAVVLKAQTNMHMLSGNGGRGGLVLENRATQVDRNDVTATQHEQGDAYGAGISLVSGAAGIAALCRRMYVGGYSSDDPDNELGVESPCDITLNASTGGSVNVQGRSINVFADLELGMGLQNGNTLMLMSNSRLLQLCNGTIDLASEAVNLDKVTVSANIPRMDSRGYGLNNSRRVSAGPPTFITRNGVAIRGDAQIEGTMSANAMLSRDGINGEHPLTGSAKAGFKLNVPKSQEGILNAVTKSWLSAAVNYLGESLTESPHTGKGQAMTSISMPISNSRAYKAANFGITVSQWQTMLSSYGTFEENPVEHAILETTMPYPGSEIYDRDDVVKGYDPSSGSTATSLQEYRTNS